MNHQVYLLRFANGKCYIGISKSAINRFRGHRYSAAHGSQLLVHKAWRLHGEPELTILAIVKREFANEIERELIDDWNTMLPNGYNMTSGGDGVRDLSPESRAKIGAHAIGNKYGLGNYWSEEKRSALSKKVKGRPKSEEARRSIGISAKASSRSTRPERIGVKVPQKIAIVNGIEYSSVKAAFEALNLPVHRHKHFRDSMKDSMRGVFSHDGVQYEFQLRYVKK